MADDLDQGYIQTRQTMRAFQSRMLMEPVQQGSDVYMGANDGGNQQDGTGAAPTQQPDPQAPVTLAPDATVPLEKKGLGELGTEIIGKTDEGRPIVKNPDGSVSTERTTTLQIDGKWTNIPTMYGGKEVSDEEAVAIIKKNGMVDPETGRKMPTFDSMQEAEAAARKRSEEDLGKYSIPQRKTITVDTPEVAAVKQQFAADMQKMASGEAGVEALGRGGKALAEAARPGFEVAARAIGMDEQAAATVGDAFVEFMGGLPGGEQSDYAAGIETALAALPVLHVAMKAGGKATEFLAANKDAIIKEFQKAAALVKNERGSVPLGGAGKFEDRFPIGAEVEYHGISLTAGITGKPNITRGVVIGHKKDPVTGDMFAEIDVPGKGKDVAGDISNIRLVGGGAGKPPTLTPPGAAGEAPLSPKQLATIAKREESRQHYDFAVEGFQAELTKQRRGPVLSDEAVQKLAGQSGFTLQDLMDLKPGSILAPEIQVKAREVYKATVDRMKTSAKAYLESGQPQDFEAFAEAFTQAGLSTTRIIGTYSEAGRTFRLLNQKYPTMKKPGTAPAKDPEFSIQDRYIQEMYKFFRGVEEKSKMGGFSQARTGQGMGPGGMISPGQLAQMVVDLPSEEAMMAFAKAAIKPTWGDMMYEIWVNGLLSGPITHSTNIISNAATLLWNIPERQVASLIKPGSVRPGEAAAMMGGVVESVGDAWRMAWKAFKEDAPQFGQSKIETPRRAITADALELTGSVGAAVDFLGNAVRLPGRFLMAGDDFFKSIAFRAELRALAKRQAFREINELGLTGKDAARKAKEIEHSILTDPPETIKEAAQEFAAYTTFTRELGTAGSAIQMAVQNVPFGRVVLPFIRTPANIFKFAGERTPLALASKAVRDELAAGGERQALALAKIGLGAMTMGYMASMAASGSITGGGPKDKVLRKQLELEGWQPYSFKIGNEYVSFARIEPLGSLIGMAADAADLMGQLGQKDSAELASALTVALSRNVANKTFVKGLAGTLNAVTSQDVHVVKSFLEKELPTLMPYSSALGQTAKNVDPVMRDVQSILDAFKAKVPGFSDELPPQRNLYGDKVLLQGGVGPDLFSPLYVKDLKHDPVAHELNRLAYPFTMPSRHVEGIPLPPKIYDRYAELAGKGSPMTGGQSLQGALQETMQTSIYKHAADGPDGGKVTLLKATINRFREMAALQLEQENKDFAQARQQMRMRAATKFDANARQQQGAAPTLR